MEEAYNFGDTKTVDIPHHAHKFHDASQLGQLSETEAVTRILV